MWYTAAVSPSTSGQQQIQVCLSSADWAGMRCTVITLGGKTTQAIHWVDQREWAPSKHINTVSSQYSQP